MVIRAGQYAFWRGMVIRDGQYALFGTQKDLEVFDLEVGLPGTCVADTLIWSLVILHEQRVRQQREADARKREIDIGFAALVSQLDMRRLGTPEFFIKLPWGKTIHLCFTPDLIVEDVKAAIFNSCGDIHLPVEQQMLLHMGKELQDGCWLCDYNIQEGDTLRLKLRKA